jgi:hypothetical protein
VTAIIETTRSALEGHLREGEVVLAATLAHLDGGTMRLASHLGIGAAGGSLGMALAPGRGVDDLEAHLTNGLVLAVTRRRIILLDVAAVSARPKRPVASVDRSRVTDVSVGEKRVMLVRMPTIAITLDGDADRVLRVEVPRASRHDAAAVARELAS